MIDYIDLKTHLENKEDNTKEYKPNFQNHKDDIGSCISAFANDFNWIGGGWIYIGVDDNGNVIGLNEDIDDIQKRIADICRNSIDPPISPHIRKISLDGKDFIEIKVIRSINRPHRYRKVCYIRVGSTTRKATHSEEEIIKQNSIVPSYDSQPAAKYSDKDINWRIFEQFIRTTKSPEIFETTSNLQEIACNLVESLHNSL